VAVSDCGPPPGDVIEETFIVDADMEGWLGVATDTVNPTIDWHVEHTTAEAYTGDGAVELFLNNINDQGKVWLERAYMLAPGVSYQVELEYAFGTSDWGDVNLFAIIAGVHDEPPRSAEELTF